MRQRRERRRHFGCFLISWPRQKEEWYFMQFNTLKRRDDLLLFKNGMHPPPPLLLETKEETKVSPSGKTSLTTTVLGKVVQIGGFSWMLI